ncbi:organic cation transporter protein-like [Ornithodoros turicata]|uniref:organic cation transporter protein-like n=1 Tax=Ornithodoros turicata TaxID=34597 RepID=UPI00313882D0
MSFEKVLHDIGGFGLFNRTIMVALVILSTWHATIGYFSHLFVLITPSGQWCFVNGSNLEDIDLTALPYKKCQIVWTTLQNDSATSNVQETCASGWRYDKDEVFLTLTMENGWVCGNSWKLYSVHTAYWIGSMVGYLITGLLADKIGRKNTVCLFVLLSCTANIAGIFITSHLGFVLLRVLAGAGCYTVCSAAFVLAMEYTVSERRTLMASVWSLSWALLATGFPWVAYYLQSWRWLLACNGVIDSLLLFTLWWAPESSSWLISTGRSEEALDILERIAKFNRKTVCRESITKALQMDTDETTAEQPSANAERSKPGFWKTTFALVATPRIRKVTLMMYSTWFIICMCYNVNNMELGRLGLDVYSTYSIAMAFELPVSVFCLLALDRLGRRWPNAAFMLIGGAVGIAVYLVRTDSNMWRLIMAVACMVAWAGSYDITYQLASETFPTVIRGRGVLLQRVLGDIGSCLGTQVAALAEYDRLLPTLVLGILSLVGTVMVFFLPETVGLPLPQTVEDGEEFGKDQGLCFCPVFASKARRKRSNTTTSSGTTNKAFEFVKEMEEKT